MARANELATAQLGDLDEHLRVRSEVEKNERYRHLELPDDLFDALIAKLPPREEAHRAPRVRGHRSRTTPPENVARRLR